MSHFNRGKAARVSKAAAAVLKSLKDQGFIISKDEEAEAINVAIASLTEREENPYFLFFEDDIGMLCQGVKEFCFVRVEPIKIGCNDSLQFDAANVYPGIRDVPNPLPYLIHGDPDAIFALFKEKMVNFDRAFKLRFTFDDLYEEKYKKYGERAPLHLSDLQAALSVW